MAPWLEWTLVLVLVLASTAYAAWRLLPQTWRVLLQVRLGWRATASGCACDACPPSGTAAKLNTPPR